MSELLEVLMELVQLGLIGYLVWRQYQAKPPSEFPDVATLLKQALLERYTSGSGRERLRARLAALKAKREGQ